MDKAIYLNEFFIYRINEQKTIILSKQLFELIRERFMQEKISTYCPNGYTNQRKLVTVH